jgi:peptidoglycan/xylan/chitin deacetylase (PgdA/CDA1 family)
MATRAMKMKTVLWSHSSEDWKFRSDEEADVCASRMILELKPRDIVLFHDERSHTVRLLNLLLPALKSAGFKVDPCIEMALNIKG